MNPTAELSNQLAPVGVTSVPEEEHVTSEVTEQVAQEEANLRLLDVLQVHLKVEVRATPHGADRDRGDDRDSIAAIDVADDWRPTQRGPCLRDRRRQEEARFVGEDEVGTQPRDFFLMRGHVSRFHCSMRSSLRSSARRSGFCTLQPRPCSRRPT